MPRFNVIHDQLFDEEIVFLHVTQESVSEVEAFLDEVELAGWVASDEDGSSLRAMGVQAYPTTLLIDAEGRIAWRGDPEELQAKRIRALL